MDEVDDKRFTDWVIEVSYAFLIWKLGGLAPHEATTERLNQLESKGRNIMRRYGQGPLGALAHMDANREQFQWFLSEGLDRKFYEYWGEALTADELDEANSTMH